jgi:hypothetical protein
LGRSLQSEIGEGEGEGRFRCIVCEAH